MTAVRPPVPYTPRRIRHVGTEPAGDGWRLKLYGIAVAGTDPQAALLDAARQRACQQLALVDDGYGAAFVVAHDTPVLCYITVAWCASVNEVHQKLYSAPAERLADLDLHGSAAIGCVWELAVHDFERRAWLEHVLQQPQAPDLDAYFNDTFADDL
jgi:hypothetical protein